MWMSPPNTVSLSGVIGKTSDGQPIVCKPGDGSLDQFSDRRKCEYDPLIPYKSARTTFHAEEAVGTPDEKKFDRLWQQQHDWLDDDIGRRTHIDKLRVAHGLSTSVGITEYQKTRVSEIVSRVNGRQFNQNGGVVGLALGAIAYVGDEEADRRGSLDARICGSDRFETVCQKHDVDGWKACRKMKEVLRK